MSELNKTVEWLEAAVPLTPAQSCVQVGCLLEEVGELLEAIGCQDNTAISKMKELADTYKTAPQKQRSAYLTHISALQRNRDGELTEQVVNVADALADIVVTATSSARQLGINMPAALEEVNRSNYSKFENGKPLFDENGKVRKGRNYSPPDLHKALECEIGSFENKKANAKLVERNGFNAFIESISERIGVSKESLEVASRDEYLGKYVKNTNGFVGLAEHLGVADVHIIFTKRTPFPKTFGGGGIQTTIAGVYVSSVQIDEENKDLRIFVKSAFANIPRKVAGYDVPYDGGDLFFSVEREITKMLHEVKDEIVAWRNANLQKGKELLRLKLKTLQDMRNGLTLK